MKLATFIRKLFGIKTKEELEAEEKFRKAVIRQAKYFLLPGEFKHFINWYEKEGTKK